MNERNLCLFLSLDEFDSLSHNRVDDVRQKLYEVILAVREPNPNYQNLAVDIQETIIELTRIKLDMEDVFRKIGGSK